MQSRTIDIKDPVQAEVYLTAVNDQVAESLTCADELSDHHADKTETDIDLSLAPSSSGTVPGSMTFYSIALRAP
ncbi:MAG: hypothetical protein ACLTSZ_17240 [Lachnospiraceae bacterium]